MKKVSKNVLLYNLVHRIGDASTVAEPSLYEDYYDYSEGKYSTNVVSKKYAEIKSTVQITHNLNGTRVCVACVPRVQKQKTRVASNHACAHIYTRVK